MPTQPPTLDLLSLLNPSQLSAVEYAGGALLVLAGAGTGKTTVMARRMAYGHAMGRSPLATTLALTFTEKATREMQERLDTLLPYGTTDRWVHTFHAFCERVLRRYGMEIGLAPQFKRLNETDFLAFLRARLESLNLVYYKPNGSPTRTLQAIAKHISRARDEGLTPAAYTAYAEALPEGDERVAAQELARVYTTVEAALLEAQYVDFGGLLLHVWRLLEEKPAVCAALQAQFTEVLVDEFQDTNWVQYAIVKKLVEKHGRLVVVGDDDQAIYAFRGASVQNILTFQQDFPQAQVIVLEENYRSRQGILDAATSFIRLNNPHRLEAQLQERYGRGKSLKSQKTEEALVVQWSFADGQEEAAGIVEEAIRLHGEGSAWQDIAILARAKDHLMACADQLRARGIPYVLASEQGLYKTEIVLDSLALLRWVVGGLDISLHIFRLLTHPNLGLKDADIIACNKEAQAKGLGLDVLAEHPPEAVSEEGKQRLKEWHACITAIRESSRRVKAFEVFLLAIEKSGLLGTLLQQEEPARTRQFAALKQFAERIQALEGVLAYGSLREVVEAIEAEQEVGEEGESGADEEAGPDEVKLLTIHKSKGLEFRAVFVVNMVNQRFPASRRSDPLPLPESLVRLPASGEDPHTEEERRLFYVAMTRAKERLYFTWARSYGGARAKNASAFLSALSVPEQDRSSGTPQTAFTLPSPYRGTLRPADAPMVGTLSFSQMRAFESCPLQYQFAHRWHVPILVSGARTFGTVVHGALEELFRAWQESGESPTQAQSQQAVRARLIPMGEGTAQEQAEEALAVQSSVDWALQYAQGQGVRVRGCEVPFLGEVEGVAMKGRLDRVDSLGDGVEVIDYKTGRAKSEDELTFDDKLQLLLYQLLAPQMFGVPAVRLSLWYVREGKVTSFVGTEKELAKAREHVRRVADGIRANTFVATPSDRTCATCDYRHICPLRSL